MRKHFGLSTLALMAALGVVAPAQAQLLNLGNNGNGATVNVGGDGGATVTIGGGGDNSGGNSPSTPATSTGGITVDLNNSDGPLLDISGDDDNDSDAVIDLNGTGTTGTGTGGSILDLGGSNDDAVLALFGNGTNTSGSGVLDLADDGDVIAIDNLLGGDGVTDGDVLLDLFGNGSGTNTAVVDLSGTTTDPNDVTVNAGDDTTAVVDIFGPSAGNGDQVDVNVGGDGTPDITANAGDETVNVDILGLGNADETSSPGDGGDGGDGHTNPDDANTDTANGGDPLGSPIVGPGANTGGDNVGDVIGNGNGTGAVRPAVRVATAAKVNARCFTPNEEQISYLLTNHGYDISMQASWKTGDVDLVPVKLCPQARARLAAAIEADDEIQWLQDAVWADARLHAALSGAGLDADNVLALDKKDGDVNVYVF